jgi:hypothetical protein
MEVILPACANGPGVRPLFLDGLEQAFRLSRQFRTSCPMRFDQTGRECRWRRAKLAKLVEAPCDCICVSDIADRKERTRLPSDQQEDALTTPLSRFTTEL